MLNVSQAHRVWHYGSVLKELYDPQTTGREEPNEASEAEFKKSFGELCASKLYQKDSHNFANGEVPSYVQQLKYTTAYSRLKRKRPANDK